MGVLLCCGVMRRSGRECHAGLKSKLKRGHDLSAENASTPAAHVLYHEVIVVSVNNERWNTVVPLAVHDAVRIGEGMERYRDAGLQRRYGHATTQRWSIIVLTSRVRSRSEISDAGLHSAMPSGLPRTSWTLTTPAGASGRSVTSLR